ncbi:MAG TPA: hypothetical protein PKE31_04855 [Pseudomonadota bacterium]|nr:hypothetical protein [Pseudomonadota bacterium]
MTRKNMNPKTRTRSCSMVSFAAQTKTEDAFLRLELPSPAACFPSEHEKFPEAKANGSCVIVLSLSDDQDA